jgi:hypothetical protein
LFHEGIWDSRLAGEIASQTVAIKEDAEDSVPDPDRRVREVKIQLEEEKMARLCLITVADWKRGHAGTQRVIRW